MTLPLRPNQSGQLKKVNKIIKIKGEKCTRDIWPILLLFDE